jgi:dTDP-4-amino-4,6-dideoxygalactose transaminase
MLGFNYRMTEIEAAIGREQLKKLPELVHDRIENVNYLSDKLKHIPCLEPAKIRPGCKHVFYVHPIKYNEKIAEVDLARFVEGVKAELMPTELRETEGVKVGAGYVKPLYMQPLFQQKTVYGNSGCPWSCGKYMKNIDYTRGICPVTERMHYQVLMTHELIRPPMTKEDLDDVVSAFNKVWENREELK